MCWDRVWALLLKSAGIELPTGTNSRTTICDREYSSFPSRLAYAFSFALEEELKATYLQFVYPYEWHKRRQLLPKEALV